MIRHLLVFCYFLLICFFITVWTSTANKEGRIVIQPTIVNNPVYKQLDKQKESFDLELELDKVQKSKTSDISYKNSRYSSLNTAKFSKDYVCKVFAKNDQIIIKIGSNGMFTAEGFNINCKNSQFRIVPYYSTDAIIDGMKTAYSYKIINQQLILNKNKYTLGDSIFGYINFNLVENEKTTFKFDKSATENRKITHIGKGYFRGKIEKQP